MLAVKPAERAARKNVGDVCKRTDSLRYDEAAAASLIAHASTARAADQQRADQPSRCLIASSPWMLSHTSAAQKMAKAIHTLPGARPTRPCRDQQSIQSQTDPG